MRFTHNTCIFLFAAAAFVHRAQAELPSESPSPDPTSPPSKYLSSSEYPSSEYPSSEYLSSSEYPSSEYPSSEYLSSSEYPSSEYPSSEYPSSERPSVSTSTSTSVNATPPPTPYPRDCWATPDPHFRSFNGLSFDFQEGCDTVLVKEARIGSNYLEIHLRLKKLDYYSAIESVGIKIGSDSLQIKDNGNYILNGPAPETSRPSTDGNIGTLGGQTLTYSSKSWGGSSYKVELPTVGTENHHIEIDMFGGSHMAIRIHGHEDVFSGSNGLCGAWSEAVNGFYDRNLQLMQLAPPNGFSSFYDATAYGNEWRVQSDTSDNPDSQILHGTLPAGSWASNSCVPQVRRRLILRKALRKLEQCTPCLELESAGASQVQIDWCNYDANAIDCDFVEDAPMYNQSNPVYSKLYSPECASCGGDPHLKTFSGHAYSYHGQCDMVLLQSTEFSSGAGLDIHIRTTRVDKAKVGYSYISGVAVKLGSDILEVMDDGMLIVNGTPVSNPVNFAGYPISKTFKGTHKNIVIYDLDVTAEKAISKPIQIRVNTNAGMIFVDISGRFPDSAGLLGPASYDKRMLARDGVTDLLGEWNSFGEEWQVRSNEPKLFQENRAPQYPQGCSYESNTSTNLRRRLSMDSGVTTKDAEAACAGSKGRSKEFCIADVMATGMVDIAQDEFYL